MYKENKNYGYLMGTGLNEQREAMDS